MSQETSNCARFALPLAAALAVLTVFNLPAGAAEKGEALAVALDYLETHRDALGLADGDLADVVVSDSYTSRHTGTRHVYLQQRFAGIEIKNAILNLAIAANGTVAHVGNRFVADLERRTDDAAPALSAIAAVERAASVLALGAPENLWVLEQTARPDRRALLSDGGISLEDIPARLVYQPLANGRLRLAWDLAIYQLDQQHWWSVRIDAESGHLLDRNDWVADESYEVYPIPVESPHHAAPLPPADGRIVEVDPFADSAASPFGWHDTDGAAGAEFTITRGNNVHAYADAVNDGVPDGGADAEPDGGAGLDFTGAVVPLDLTLDPRNSPQAAIANLFYWNNVIHDVTWNYGFDEAAGNFQVDNYGNGGLGGDDVRAEAQDGGGNCNANFGTPEDGMRPRMQMYLCSNASPRRDGSLDNGVVTHEYGHGISNRLTGGPSEVGCLNNTEQMGEGWSDYLGLIFTVQAGDAGTDPRGTGTWLFGQGPNGGGIRPAPYSTDFGVNNFTYSGISGVSIPHGVGFVWATMIWDMTWALIDEHGLNPDLYGDWTTGGNNLAMQLVMDGMKLQACSPGFVDGRDAILAADDLLTGDGSSWSGVNRCTIWGAFANRGLGASADQGDVNDVDDGAEAFDLPAACATIGDVTGTQNICQGQTATWRIGVGDQFTLPPVAMSAAGEPAGTTASFSVNPVAAVPGITDFSVSDTGSATPGGYPITVTGTDATPTAFDTTVDLNVFDAAPAAGPALVAPADGAVDEPIQPTFEWAAVADAVSYTLELDDDPAFGSIDYSVSGLTGLSHTLPIELDYLATYYWRVRGDNPCGGGAESATFSFTTLLFPGLCPPNFAPELHFEDDLEGGALGWTSEGTGNTWMLSGARVTSGTNAFYAVDPASLSDQRLISPPVVLPTGVLPLTLQYQNYQAFETPNGDGRCWDAGVLEITTDAGANWSKVPQGALLTDPYDNVIWNDDPGNNPITIDYGATLAWCNELEPFVPSVVDLSAWSGETVQFRWRLGSDSLVGNEGWYIDDVVVQSCLDSTIFTDGFESGDTSVWSTTNP